MLKHKLMILGVLLSLSTGLVVGNTFSKSQIQKVEKLLEVGQFDQMLDNQIDLIVNNLIKEPMFANHKKEIKEIMKGIMNAKALKKDMTIAYLNSFTESEIDEMIKFHQSPVGQKMLKKLPEFSQMLLENMQKNDTEDNKKKLQDLLVRIAMENVQTSE